MTIISKFLYLKENEDWNYENKLKYGYIYIRKHNSYNGYIKLGVTTSIPDRESTYITSEFVRGEFTLVLSIPLIKMRLLDNHLKNIFQIYHKQDTGGTEFYEECIHDKITPELDKLNLKYKKLSPDEINSLLRKQRVKKSYRKIDTRKLINYLKSQGIQPTYYQQKVLENINEFYQINNKGKLIWACGLGKALMSLFIVKNLKYTKICIGVPSIFLQGQFKKEIVKLFPKKENILFIGGPKQNSIDDIKRKLKITTINKPIFVITTYDSCHKLVNSEINFDLLIGDEAHHLVGVSKEEGKKTYDKFHRIQTNKSLFMTATERVIENDTRNAKFSMDDTNIFGEYIDQKSVHWAIEKKRITDYNLSILKNKLVDIEDIIESCGLDNTNEKRNELFLSAYMSLLCLSDKLEKYQSLTHVLIYCNTIANAKLVDDFITILLEKKIVEFNNIYHKHTDTEINLEKELKLFKKANRGIISCVYKLGEGVDLKFLNGVVFAENMDSEIRIVQSALRPNRLNSNDPNKIAFLLVPYIEDNERYIGEDDKEYNSFEKLREIVKHLGNVDENIEQRMNVTEFTRNNKKDENNNIKEKKITNITISDDLQELSRLKTRLRHRKALSSNCSEEQDEYNYHRSINKQFNIKSKKEYLELPSRHKAYFPNAEENFIKNGVWKNWYHFLGIDTTKFIKNKEEWKKVCQEYNIKTVPDYQKKCLEDNRLPYEPIEFYLGYTNLSHELGLHTKRRR